MSSVWRLFLIIALLTIFAAVVYVRVPRDTAFGSFLTTSYSAPESVLFVGDIMLARDVETRITEVGKDRFFSQIKPLHESSKYVVANFEATVPATHEKTPILTFKFSVHETLLPLLAGIKVTHASLANNHALDFGERAYENAWDKLLQNTITPFGNPRTVSASSTTEIVLDGAKVGIVGIHTVWKEPSRDEVVHRLSQLSSTTDIQVVFIHWGTEYSERHTDAQEAYARFLIKNGADVIIGHHPHVIEDVAVIDGVPVFYSLGNYVFDQYWSDAVKTGLAVRMSKDRHALYFELIPIGIDRAVPRVLTSEEAKKVLLGIADRSTPELREMITSGTIRIPR